jgi:phosphate transport system protein
MKEMDEQLGALKDCVLRMALMAETMLHRTIQALVLRDNTKADKLDDLENSVNKLQIEIDQRGANILALRQPMAHDLRFIIATMKIASDIERIADQAINISENVEILTQVTRHELLPDLMRMADLTQKMVEETFKALVEEDTDSARKIVLRDDEVDALKDLIFRQLMRSMIADVHRIQDGLQIILVSRHLERIADHATNIAEGVVYMVEARDIRHHAEAMNQKSLE